MNTYFYSLNFSTWSTINENALARQVNNECIYKATKLHESTCKRKINQQKEIKQAECVGSPTSEEKGIF